MNLSKTFVDRPIATSLIMAAIFLAGVLAFTRLPIAPIPQVDFPTIIVSAGLPGADAETMASSVATPLERQFARISGLDTMTSSSTLGQTSISLQFKLEIPIDTAAQDVAAAINAASANLPANLPNPPVYYKTNPSDAPVLILGVWSDVLPIDQVSDMASNILAQSVSQIPGVGRVNIFGEQKPAVRVQVNPAALANANLSIEDVRNALVRTTVNLPKGSINGPLKTSTISANDQLTTAEEYRRVIITYRNGAPVHISDIGTAIDSMENSRTRGWVNQHQGNLMGIFRQPGANILSTTEGIKARLPQLRAQMPPSMNIDILSDRTLTIRASVREVEQTLVITIALVVMVIFVFLRRVWATVIPAVVVPLALTGTCGVMYAFGYSLDNLSLMAMTVAVGFVVDDAIVMIENIVRHIEKGESAYEATIKGAREIGFTIISITIALVAVFIPILLMGGIAGRLFREFAVTLSAAVLISGFVSLTLTPTMCALFLDKKEEHHSRFYETTERFFTWLNAAYARMLDVVMKHQRQTVWTFWATIALSLGVAVYIPKGFFPQQDNGLLFTVVEAVQDISFEDMVKKHQQVLDIMARDPDMGSLPAYVGGADGMTPNSGRVFASLKPFDERNATADEIVNRLRPQFAQIPGVRVFNQPRQDLRIGVRMTSTQFQYTLQGTDYDELSHWATVMLDQLRAVPDLRDVATDQQNQASRTMVKIDREIASRMGVAPREIDETLYSAFGQRQVGTIYTQLNQYKVVLEVDPKYQLTSDALNAIYVRSDAGNMVPLSTFAKVDTETAPLIVSHQGQFPAVTLSFNLASGKALGDAVTAIKKIEQDVRLPASILPSFQGTAQAFQDSLVTMPLLILAALLSVYIVLGVLYESYIHPLTILSTIPSAGVGALVFLAALGFQLDTMGLIGLILLIGIVQKNAIMMIDFALEAERQERMPPEEAIYQAALTRFRPIMMTTMSAFVGGLMLMFAHGAGSEFRKPLGTAIVGGLIASQALTLFTTPVIYLYLDRFGKWLRAGRKKQQDVATAPQAATPMRLDDAAE